MKKSIQLSSLALAVITLSACGGGGNQSHTANPVNPSTELNPATPTGPTSPPTTENPTTTQPNHGEQEKPWKPRFGNKIRVTPTPSYHATGGRVYDADFIILKNNYGQENIKLNIFPRNQLSEVGFEMRYNTERRPFLFKESGVWRVYNQKYSVVQGERTLEFTNADGQQVETRLFPHRIHIELAIGYPTQPDELPKMGTATYHGVAFDGKEQGNLTYHVDFADKQGYGEITGLSTFGTVTLEPGSISNKPMDKLKYTDQFFSDQLGISSNATNASDAEAQVTEYRLQFFGPGAKEVAGIVYNTSESRRGRTMIGFGGSQ